MSFCWHLLGVTGLLYASYEYIVIHDSFTLLRTRVKSVNDGG